MVIPTYQRDKKYRIAINAHANVWQPYLPVMEGQDSIYQGAGQVPNYESAPNALTIPKRLPIYNRTWSQNQLEGTLLGQDIFYGSPGQSINYEAMPNALVVPQKQRPHNLTLNNNSLETNLVGQDQFYSDPGHAIEFTLNEKYIPKRVVLPSGFDSWQDLLNTLLLGQDTIYGDPGQAPLSVNGVQPNVQGGNKPKKHGQLIGGLAYDYFLSSTSAFDTWQNRLLNPLFAQDTIYGAPGQVPNYEATPYALSVPPRAPIYNRTWIAQYLQTLIGKDTFYGNFGQSINYEAYPFALVVPPKQPIHNKTWIDSLLNSTLLGQDTFYREPGESPYQSLEFIYRKLVLKFDWIYQYPQEIVEEPFHGESQPLITFRKVIIPFDNQSTVALNVVERLGSQSYEIPVIRPSNNRTWLQNLVNYELLGQDSIYGSPGQSHSQTIELPRIKVYDFTSIKFGSDRILQEDILSKVYDYQLPTYARNFNRSWIFVKSINLGITAQSPLTIYDYQLPIVASRSKQLGINFGSRDYLTIVTSNGSIIDINELLTGEGDVLRRRRVVGTRHYRPPPLREIVNRFRLIISEEPRTILSPRALVKFELDLAANGQVIVQSDRNLLTVGSITMSASGLVVVNSDASTNTKKIIVPRIPIHIIVSSVSFLRMLSDITADGEIIKTSGNSFITFKDFDTEEEDLRALGLL